MRYVTARPLADPLARGPRLVVVPVGAVRGAGEPPAEVDEMVDYRLCRPRVLNDDAGPFLIACGFLLRLRSPLALRWARLRVTPASLDTTIVSAFPRTVVEPQRYTGRIVIAPDGQINRETARHGEDADSDTLFEPSFTTGLLPDERGVFWDVHSSDGRVPSGTNRLILALKAAEPWGQALSMELLIAVGTGPASPDLHLRAPAETAWPDGERRTNRQP